MIALIATTAWLQRPPPAAPVNVSTSLLAPDGHVEVLVGPGVHVVVETAMPSTASLLGSGPPAFALSNPDNPPDMLSENYQRVTSTWTRPDSVSQTEEFYRLGSDGVSLTTWSRTGGQFKVFQSGVLLLPSDIAPGRTWSGEGVLYQGSALDFSDVTQHPYSFTARAMPGSVDPNVGLPRNATICLDVELTMTEDKESTTSTRTWCEGLGLIAESSHGINGVSRSQEKLPPFSLDDDHNWSPQRWADPTTRTLTPPPPVSWNLATAPIDLRGGFVLTDQNSGDVVATDDSLTGVRWRSHPGGSITHTTTAGELIVVATTQRRLVAYDRRGLRRWTRELPDLVAHTPQRHGDRLIVADVGGRVHAIDLRRGFIAWTHAVHHRIVEAPHAGDVIVVAHAQPGITALDQDGKALWTRELDDPADSAVATASSVVVGDGPVLRQFDAAGTPMALEPTREGQAHQVATLDDGTSIVVRYRGALAGYSTSPELNRTWQVPFEATRMIVVGSTIVAANNTDIIVISATGQELHRWRSPAASRSELFLAPRDDGFFLLDRQFRLTEVTP